MSKRMGWMKVAFLAACVAAAGHALAAKPMDTLILDDEYRSSLEARTKSMQALKSQDGRSLAHDCPSFVKAVSAGVLEKQSPNPADLTPYLACIAKPLLASAVVMEAGAIKTLEVGKQIHQSLDMGTVRSSLGPRRPSDHFVLADIKGQWIEFGRTALLLSEPGWSRKFQALASGHFTGEPGPQLLVEFTDKAKDSSYDSTQLLVLSPATINGRAMLVAEDALEAAAAGRLKLVSMN